MRNTKSQSELSEIRQILFRATEGIATYGFLAELSLPETSRRLSDSGMATAGLRGGFGPFFKWATA